MHWCSSHGPISFYKCRCTKKNNAICMHEFKLSGEGGVRGELSLLDLLLDC